MSGGARRPPPKRPSPNKSRRLLTCSRQVEHRSCAPGGEHAEISYRRHPEDDKLVSFKIDDLDDIEQEVQRVSRARARGRGGN